MRSVACLGRRVCCFEPYDRPRRLFRVRAILQVVREVHGEGQPRHQGRLTIDNHRCLQDKRNRPPAQISPHPTAPADSRSGRVDVWCRCCCGADQAFTAPGGGAEGAVVRQVRKLNISRASDPPALCRPPPTPLLPNRVMLNCPPAPEEGDSHGHILMKTISERSCELVSIPSPFFDACPLYPLPFAGVASK